MSIASTFTGRSLGFGPTSSTRYSWIRFISSFQDFTNNFAIAKPREAGKAPVARATISFKIRLILVTGSPLPQWEFGIAQEGLLVTGAEGRAPSLAANGPPMLVTAPAV
jgi:hypothetical protein